MSKNKKIILSAIFLALLIDNQYFKNVNILFDWKVLSTNIFFIKLQFAIWPNQLPISQI